MTDSTNDVRFLTHEIGSLAKPPWHVRTAAGRPLEESDVEHARSWGKRLGVPGHEELVELLARGTANGGAPKDEVARWSSRYCVRLLESAGLDVVYDGEQQRSEMYAWAIDHANGFEPRGIVRSFDNKYYSKSAVTGPISLAKPYHNEEFEFLQSIAASRLKIPVTGAYTLAIWSYDEHYAPKQGALGEPAGRAKEIAARREFALDIARNLIRPNLEALIELGADWIQIDEPGASTEPDELEVFVESFNASVEGLDCFFSTHLCFSEYNLFFPAIEGMSGCRQYAVGFANYDTRDLGTSDDDRPGYHVIRKFRDLSYQPILGLGVLDIHTDFVEPPELVRDRILYAVDVFGDPGRLHVTPDCGLRTRSWDVAHAKLANMVEGARLAEDALTRELAGARAPGA
jgi:5-methyltetrahydropteroyltriglutamate--homocysteine methyltransferase